MDDMSSSPVQTDDVPQATRADGLWADDLEPGQTFTSGEYEITEAGIIEFARQFDPQPFHVDAAAAVGTFFDRLVASGWYTAAVTTRLFVDAFPVATGVIGGQGTVAWPSATLPGDRLHVEVVIDEIRWSQSRPNRARMTVSHQTVTQHGEVRQRTTAQLIAWERPTITP